MGNDVCAGGLLRLGSGSVVCRGALVPKPAEWGSVYGIFGTVVSLRCTDGMLVSLLDAFMPMEARAVRLTHGCFHELREAVRLGCTVSVRMEDWNSVPVWMPEQVLAMDAVVIDAGLLVLEGVLERYHELGSLVGTGVWAKKYKGLRQQINFPACLVGFGPGTTPAGDDFIAGWLLAERICPAVSSTELVLDSLDNTSPAGKTLLNQCLQGMFPELYIEFARAFVSGAKNAVADAVDKMTKHGATSGFDMLYGFYTRLAGDIR